jgi:hypothetical protein
VRSAAAVPYVVIAALVTACSSGPAAAPRHDVTSMSGQVQARLALRGQFISLRFAPHGRQGSSVEVAVSSVSTGAIVRRLLPASRDGMHVDGLSLDWSGNLWITYSAGPDFQSDVAGGCRAGSRRTARPDRS